MAPSPDGPSDHLSPVLSDRACHDLLTSLTVIKAEAQMLRRWIRRSSVADGTVVVARLDRIEAMVATIAADLNARRQDTHRDPAVADGSASADGPMPDPRRR